MNKTALCRGGVVVLSAVLMAGCAIQSKQVVTASEHDVWTVRQQQMEGVNQWSFDGRVAVRDSESEGWNASLRWQQLDEQYDIKLFGLLGQGGARIYGNGGEAIMESGENPPLTADSPEALMLDQLGWYVPVRGLKYWLVGQPLPDETLTVADYELDRYGRMERLSQDGWEITYKRYARVNGLELPRKLELNNKRLRVRVVIDQWRLHEQTGV